MENHCMMSLSYLLSACSKPCNWNGFLLPPANEVCDGYVFTRVCQSFCSWGGWGVSASVHDGTHTHCPLGSRHPPGGRPPQEADMLGDTGNKRAVRILLEYTLVQQYFIPRFKSDASGCIHWKIATLWMKQQQASRLKSRWHCIWQSFVCRNCHYFTKKTN